MSSIINKKSLLLTLNVICSAGAGYFNFFRALNPSQLAKEKEKYQELVLSAKINKIFKEAVRSISQNMILCFVITKIAGGIPQGQPTSYKLKDIDLKELCIIGPLIEEILFRGVAQNIAWLGQKQLQKKAPDAIKNKIGFRILTSPSTLIIGINTLFAMAHLTNSGWYLSNKAAKMQCVNILFIPTYSLLHYTTGNIIPSFFVHALNNMIVSLVLRRTN